MGKHGNFVCQCTSKLIHQNKYTPERKRKHVPHAMRLQTFACGTCLGAMLVCIAVCAVADDSPKSDETGLATEGVCSIGILMCVLFVDVFIAVEEL